MTNHTEADVEVVALDWLSGIDWGRGIWSISRPEATHRQLFMTGGKLDNGNETSVY